MNNLVAWVNKWPLNFNVSKCHLLYLGGSYNICGTQISINDSVKDLGVIVDNQLKFHNYTNFVLLLPKQTIH